MSDVSDPFNAIEAALKQPIDGTTGLSVRVDAGRQERTGVPEVILGDAKDDAALVEAASRMLERVPRVIISRIELERARRIADAVAVDVEVERPYPGWTVVLARPCHTNPDVAGFVGILTAGTSDLAVAGEAATIASEIGCRVEIVADVGVAGLHRLVRPLRRIMRDGADVIIVAAGMDGALPSVVAGLVDVPVIGLPTSIGYGVAAGGHAALMTMLATCSPGMSVVNIDNGIGAGATAALIATRAARGRQSRT